MSVIHFFSYCILWFITLTLSCMVFYLFKRIESSKNVKRTLAESNSGFPKGQIYPIKSYYDLTGKEIKINSSYEGTVLLFTSAHCDVCKRIYPLLEIVKQSYPQINFVLMMLATNDEAISISNRFNIKRFPISLIRDEELNDLGVAGFPFSYLLAQDGKIIEKGIVNYKDHFDILLANHVKSERVS